MSMTNKLATSLLLAYALGATGCMVGSDEQPDFEPAADEPGVGNDDAGNPPPTDAEDPLIIAALYPTVTLASNTIANTLVKDGSYLYWSTADSIMRVPVTGGTPVKVAGSLRSPQGIAADSTNLYWAEYGNSTDLHCYIKKMPKVGGTITKLYAGSYGCAGLAIDSTYVYWTNYAAGKVGKINKGGYGLDYKYVGGRPAELLVDTTGNLYWLDPSLGEVDALLDGDSEAIAIMWDQAPTHMAISGAYIYWTNYDYGTVMRANRACSTCTTDVELQTLATGQAGPRGIDVAGGWLYWTNSNTGAQMKSYLDGTNKAKITSVEPGAEKLLVRYRASRTPPSLYWTNPSTKKIMKIDQY